MIFVYPYKKRSECFEIMQSIRWLQHSFPDCKIYTVGDAIDGINNIPCKQFNNIRGCDVTHKILTFANNIGGKFVYMNDDFYLSPNFNYKLPIFNGNLKINSDHPVHYQIAVQNTIDFLKYYNKPIVNYETHSPILIDSKKLIKTFIQCNWKEDNHFIKSIYLNFNPPIKSVPGCNVKINASNISTALKYLDNFGCFSTGKAFLDDNGANFIKTSFLPPQQKQYFELL